MIVNPIEVRTLLGEKTLDVSLACLPTLLRYSHDPIRLVIHEDGTLSDSGRERLAEALPGAKFVGRVESDEIVLPQLASYPNCLHARSNHPLYLKLFDIALMASEQLNYVDSDILFLKPFRNLYQLEGSGFDCLFMQDVKHAYSVRPWWLWPFTKLRLCGRVNTGILAARRGVLDLDRIEWVLAKFQDRAVWDRRRYWTEQTCWAALAAQFKTGLYDAEQFVLANAGMTQVTSKTVAIHFVSTFRHHLADYTSRPESFDGEPINVTLHRAGRVGPVGQFLSDWRK